MELVSQNVRQLRILLIGLAVVFCAHTKSIGSDALDYLFACRANTYMLDDFHSGTKSITSPDHTKQVILAKDYSFRVLDGNREIGRLEFKDLSSNICVTWAPDSRKFSVTYSNGGAIGLYRAHLYQVTQGGLVELSKPVEAAFDNFKKQFYCETRGNNIRVLGWRSDSRAVFFLTQVYPTGDCGEGAGREEGYTVDLAGILIRRFSNREAELIELACEKSNSVVLPGSSR